MVLGAQVLIIDPEEEYRTLSQAVVVTILVSHLTLLKK
jgi:hypothetical protein